MAMLEYKGINYKINIHVNAANGMKKFKISVDELCDLIKEFLDQMDNLASDEFMIIDKERNTNILIDLDIYDRKISIISIFPSSHTFVK